MRLRSATHLLLPNPRRFRKLRPVGDEEQRDDLPAGEPTVIDPQHSLVPSTGYELAVKCDSMKFIVPMVSREHHIRPKRASRSYYPS